MLLPGTVPVRRIRDSARQKCYDFERKAFNELGGKVLCKATERSVAGLANKVCRQYHVRPVTAEIKRAGATWSHYHHDGRIRIAPYSDPAWFSKVVLHEVCHHVMYESSPSHVLEDYAPAYAAHGKVFVGILMRVYAQRFGWDQSELVRIANEVGVDFLSDARPSGLKRFHKRAMR